MNIHYFAKQFRLYTAAFPRWLLSIKPVSRLSWPLLVFLLQSIKAKGKHLFSHFGVQQQTIWDKRRIKREEYNKKKERKTGKNKLFPLARLYRSCRYLCWACVGETPTKKRKRELASERIELVGRSKHSINGSLSLQHRHHLLLHHPANRASTKYAATIDAEDVAVTYPTTSDKLTNLCLYRKTFIC